jgi:hypothetical protein
MKERQSLRLTLILSYIFLATRGNGTQSMNQGENSGHIVTCQQFNETIEVWTNNFLISISSSLFGG